MHPAFIVAATVFLGASLHAASEPPVGEPIEVFVGGQGGYPVYRIPAATRLEHASHAGRLLAFAEGRPQLADVTDNDIVLRSSDDGGATWSEVRVLADMAGRSLNNPCVVELRDGSHAGRVLLMFQSYPENMGEHHVVEGYGSPDGPDRVCRTMVMHSDDGGATWSVPREVTRGVKRETGATSTATGPGVGIQLSRGPHKGRVIMPFNEGPFDRWRVYAAYSDDGGESWRAGEVAPNDAKGLANEVQMFERADGAVVLNARQHLGAKRRKTATSLDGGATWSVLADVPELPDPTCMGGVLALGGGVVVFTGCDSETRRAKGAVWFSRDDGRSWSEKAEIEPGGFAYSVPVRLSPTEIGVVYEGAGYQRIVMRRISVPQAPAAASPAAR
ncbi:MAG: sialidase family protein [Phycisphaerales bacterium]